MDRIIPAGHLPAKTVEVSSSGAEYTTIQAALTANATENLIVLVYPGTYANDTIAFTANGQCVVGVGDGAQQVVTNTVQIVNFAAYTSCVIENMTLTGTYSSAVNMIAGSGSLKIDASVLNVTASGTIAGSPTVASVTGSLTINDGSITYANTATSTSQIKRAINIGTGATVSVARCSITVSGSGASTAHTLVYGTSTGTLTMRRSTLTVTDADSSIVAGYYSAGSGSNVVVYNDITVTAGAAATGYGIFVSGTESLRSSWNRIYTSPSAGADYAFFVDTNATLNSFFDDIDFGTAVSAGGGTLKYVSSLADGAASATASLTAPTVYATTFDTNVAAAGVTLAGVTLAADGTDANIDINLTPKGTGEVNITKADIDAGTIDGVTIGGSSAAAATVTTLTASGAVSATSADGIITRQAATQDGIKLLGRAGGTGDYEVTLTPTTLSADRTVTFPDAAITVAGSAAALTSGRVPYVTTGGLLTDSAKYKVEAGTFFSTGYILGDGSDNTGITLCGLGPGNSSIGLLLCRGGATTAYRRWFISTDTAETGSDTGGRLAIGAYNDSGTFIDYPIQIVRAAAGLMLFGRPISCSSTLSATSLTATGLTSGRVPYVTTGGLLTDSANFTWSGTTFDIASASATTIRLDTTAAGAANPAIVYRSGGNIYWYVGIEGGSGGKKWFLYDNVGTDNAITVVSGAGGAITLARPVSCSNTTASTSTTTGALVVSGGVGVAGAIYGGSILNLPASSATTTAGNLQRETNQDTHYAYTNGIGGWIDKCIFSQYASVTHSGAVTSQSLASATARGTRTVPANFFKAGKVLKYRLCGVYTTDAAPGNATVLIKIGSTTFRTTGSFALDGSVTDGYWVLDGEITCYTTGATGTIAGQASWVHAQTTSPTESALYEQPMTTYGTVTFDTTAAGAFDVEWTATDSGTAITCSCFRLWEVC